MSQKKTSLIFIVFGICIGFFLVNQMSCTHDDQVLDEFIPIQEGPTFSESELLVHEVDKGPTLDGEIDLAWEDAQKLINKVVVPDPGDDVFKGYVGNTFDFTLRALYDANNIYFLAEWTDNNMDFNRQTWYFDPGDKAWKQESRIPLFNEKGVVIRPPFYEDKFAMLWNVAGSVTGWDDATCYATCHTGLGAEKGFARHYTGGPGERIDMWHWKSVRNGVANGQADDQYQDEAQPNGRHSDSKVSGGYTNNKQEVELEGVTVAIPKYLVPGREYYFWITKEDIDAGIAKLITSVDQDGVLYYDGGSIDPNTDLSFQREGSTVGSKGIPSVYIEKWVGNRGDILAASKYTGSGWVLELQRKLKTDDTESQDVDFSGLEDQPFGIGIFENAGIAHAIKPNLLLKFEKN